MPADVCPAELSLAMACQYVAPRVPDGAFQAVQMVMPPKLSVHHQRRKEEVVEEEEEQQPLQYDGEPCSPLQSKR